MDDIKPLPSAFQLAEWPIYTAAHIFDVTSTNCRNYTHIQSILICQTIHNICQLASDIFRVKSILIFIIRHPVEFIKKIRSRKILIFKLGYLFTPMMISGYHASTLLKQLYEQSAHKADFSKISITTIWKATKFILPMIGAHSLGKFALLLSLKLTPITMIADIAIGAIESTYHCTMGSSYKQLTKLAYKKIVLAPSYTILFWLKIIINMYELTSVNNRIMFIISWILQLMGLFNSIRQGQLFNYMKGQFIGLVSQQTTWKFHYEISRNTISMIPEYGVRCFFYNIDSESKGDTPGFLSCKDFTIFTPVGEYKKGSQKNWENFIQKEKKELQEAPSFDRLAEFRKKAMISTTPSDILDNPSDEAQAKRAYRLKSLKVHPDKNSNSAESTILSRILNEAYSLYSQRIVRSQFSIIDWTRTPINWMVSLLPTTD